MRKMENYFTLLGLPVSFDLDVVLLERQYFTLQREYHPDRFVHRPQQERLQNMQKATTINEAYHILKDQLKRAEYLLKLEGIKESKPDEALLAEAMRQREALMEAESPAQIEKLERRAHEQRKHYIENIGKAFSNKRFTEASQLTIQLKYAEKLKDEIRLKKQNIGHD